MDVYRRNSFGSWLADVGWLYAIVILLVALMFLFPSLSKLPFAFGIRSGHDYRSPASGSRILVHEAQQTHAREIY